MSEGEYGVASLLEREKDTVQKTTVGTTHPLRFTVISCMKTPHKKGHEVDVLVCHAPAVERDALKTRGVISLHSFGWEPLGERIFGEERPGEHPLLVGRGSSVGWLLRVYLRHTMAMVYAELPCPASRVSHLLSAGVLGSSWRQVNNPIPATEVDAISETFSADDEEIYALWQASLAVLEPMMRGYLRNDARKEVSAVDVAAMMDELSYLTGCRAEGQYAFGDTFFCYVPRVAELYALIWMCVAQEQSPERALHYALEGRTVDTDQQSRLMLNLDFICPAKDGEPEADVRKCLDFCQALAELNDAIFLWSLDSVRQERDWRGEYGVLHVSLTFGGDPVRERWSDFKHPSLWSLGVCEPGFGI